MKRIDVHESKGFSGRGRSTSRWTRLRSALRHVTMLLLMIGMVLLAPGGTRVLYVHAQGAETAGPVERLDALFAAYEAFFDSVDPLTIDLEELTFELAFETPETIAEWVATNVAYHPYQGVLRGAAGTLLALGGNSLDQSLLLAQLLNDAGYEARIAYASVPDDGVADLLRQASAAPHREPVPQVLADEVTAQGILTDDQLVDAQRQIEAAYQEFDATFVREQEALAHILAEQADLHWDTGATPGGIHETTYAWVDLRASPDAPWERFHPVFASPPAWSETLEAEDVIVESVPDELQHRLRFRVVLEQRLGDDVDEKAITAAWERPVANLIGSAFSFTTVPDTLANDSGSEVEADEAFESATFIFPVFQGELAPGAQLFDLKGNTAPPEAASSPAAGVFQSVGNALGGATGALSGQDEAVALSALWLEFTLVEPGGTESVYRRSLVDRIGAANRASGSTEFQESVGTDEVVRALQTSHTFMVDPGGYPVNYVHRTNAETMLEHQGYLRSLFTADASTPVGSLAAPPELTSMMRTFDHLRQFLTFDARAISGDALTYRNRPVVSVISKSWDGSRSMTDVLQNDRVSFSTSDGDAPRFSPAHTHEMGIWETVTEGVALGRADRVFSVPSYMANARDQGISTVVIAPTEADRVQEIDVPFASREAMIRDLDRGYLVVTPTRTPDGDDRAAWWRVHPETGVTLGRGLDGRGVQEGFNYAALLISVAFGIAGGLTCLGGGGSGVCCGAEAVGWLAIGVALGAAVGAIGGWLALGELGAANVAFGFGAAFDFASFNMGLAGILPTMCTSSSTPREDGVELAGLRSQGRTVCTLGPILGIDFDNVVATAR